MFVKRVRVNDLRKQLHVFHRVTHRPTRDPDGDLARLRAPHPSLRDPVRGGAYSVQAIECRRGANGAANVRGRRDGAPMKGDEAGVAAGAATCHKLRVERVQGPPPEVTRGFQRHAGLRHGGLDVEDGAGLAKSLDYG